MNANEILTLVNRNVHGDNTNTAAAAGIADCLDANEADVAMVLDMADTLVEFGVLPSAYRAKFIEQATDNRQARIDSDNRILARNVR